LSWPLPAPGMSLLHQDLHLSPAARDLAGARTAARRNPGRQLYADAHRTGAPCDVVPPALEICRDGYARLRLAV
jgi:hypothetical protein